MANMTMQSWGIEHHYLVLHKRCNYGLLVGLD